MFCAFVGFTLAALPPLLFVAYCRSLLRTASETELSTAALNAIAEELAGVSAEDFHRLRALLELCPLGQKDAFPLAVVSIYFFLLAVIYAISLRLSGGIGNWTERERQRCSHFVAVSLDKRIASARRLRAEQMIHPEK
jgi:hypothetical protein